jgi:hypothetical protein
VPGAVGVVSLAMAALAAVAAPLYSQANYEIQVYGSDLVPRGRTMVELHSNFSASGERLAVNGVFATQHALRETLEITRGFSEWFEVGFYAFTAAGSEYGWQWVGDHLRPRVAVPERWNWPLGVSISNEFGYQRRAFSEDTWTWEIRPIVDQRLGRWYWSLNPVFDRALRGANSAKGFGFSPNAALMFDFTRKIAGAVEYYGSFGPVTRFDPSAEQQQQIFPSLNLDLGPDWEFNFGVGAGLTRATDGLIVKTIVGYRLGRHRAGVAPGGSGAH